MLARPPRARAGVRCTGGFEYRSDLFWLTFLAIISVSGLRVDRMKEKGKSREISEAGIAMIRERDDSSLTTTVTMGAGEVGQFCVCFESRANRVCWWTRRGP